MRDARKERETRTADQPARQAVEENCQMLPCDGRQQSGTHRQVRKRRTVTKIKRLRWDGETIVR